MSFENNAITLNNTWSIILERDFNNINKDKILSKITNPEFKKNFELRYNSLKEYFKQAWEQIYDITRDELSLFKESLNKDKKQDETIKNKLILKYSLEYKWLQSDVIKFINSSFSNSLQEELWSFNTLNFNNKDNKKWFSEYELKEYINILDKSISNMDLLWWYEQFKAKCKELWEEPSFMSWKWDIALANKVDIQEYIFWKWKNHITDKICNYSEEELHKMKNQLFNITKPENIKNFFILLGIEIWNQTEDLLKILWNIPSWIILIPRYTNNRILLKDWEINTKKEVEAKMENDMLLKENPSLILLELLWEKWVQLIKQLWEMMLSWKNWDIIWIILTISWLLAWGVWLIGLWAKVTKKIQVWNIPKYANTAEKLLWKTEHSLNYANSLTFSWIWLWINNTLTKAVSLDITQSLNVENNSKNTSI